MGELRILIENSEYWLRNNGDLAMLDVTITRLRERWPTARIGVLTDSPSLLHAYFPRAEGMTVFDEDPWAPPTLVRRAAGRLGPRVVGPPALAWLRSRAWLPQKMRGARRRLTRYLHPQRPVIEQITSPRPHVGSMRAAREATIVVALGGGYLTDSDKAQSRRVLTVFEHALAHDVPVVMVGQGVGPMTDPELLQRCSAILPRVDMIALREERRGPALLDAVGVSSHRVRVTGDDAIELAYNASRVEYGTGVGLCLRVADYNPVDAGMSETVGRVVRAVADEREAPLIPLIIAEYRNQDRKSTLPLVRGAAHVVRPPGRYVHPVSIAERVGNCRVLVTGAYHLAVFALSQGIPVVAITSSEYYEDKFLGLAGMFGTGLTHIRLGDPLLPSALRSAIERSWVQAPDLREPLRARARAQISLSRDAFDHTHELIERTVSQCL